ncbi:MAG: PEGA domain-containing protein [Acidobacteria bacterium]|nr:PEGA domain-containing protein [Acidobacteriota bacterium]
MSISTFADGFGRRFRPEGEGEPPVETLLLCEDLARLEGIDLILAERIAQLSNVAHPCLAATRSVERREDARILTSEYVPGTRLADVLRTAERHWLDPEPGPALGVLLQVTGAVAALHEHDRHAAHGAIGPERIVIREDGVAVVVEGVLGAALELSGLTRTVLWRQFRVAVPAVAGAPSLGQGADVMQLGVLALALLRGRLLGRDDFPGRLAPLLHEAAVADPLGHRPAVPAAVRSWITRALQFDARAAFRSAREAESALAKAMAESGLGRPSNALVAGWVEATLAGRAFERPAASLPAAASVPGATPPAPAAEPVSRLPVARLPRPCQRRRGGRPVGRLLRAAAIAAGLVVLWGGAYLGARSVLGFPSLLFPTGHLTVLSQPAGLEVLLNGEPLGSTPLSVEVRAGRHTLALRSSRSTTLVPVTVEPGVWHTERIEVRRGRRPLRTSTIGRTAPPEASRTIQGRK